MRIFLPFCQGTEVFGHEAVSLVFEAVQKWPILSLEQIVSCKGKGYALSGDNSAHFFLPSEMEGLGSKKPRGHRLV